ncbi:hypothetical protein C8A00DRAFT_17138 [Chaetomidium leptoderma]|uniref:Uncharacterized protein n=1 Tax=Chaetomidium leptoderma TaxID=669021 RepID=A0AAN6VH92_9PEZI|nr:hypothetical protein C8A00DRAFT_17138 [Chaetomidium leptoderma]
MCYIRKTVYTVCTHTRVGELVECKSQKAKNEQWQGGGCYARVQLAVRSCRPFERLRLRYWLCDDCCLYYEGYDTRTLNAVLSYWAFKNECRYSFSVSPKLIPAELVFGRTGPVLEDPKAPRCELIALGKVLPSKRSETPAEWLERLEKARASTLDLAENWSNTLARLRNRESVADVVRMQPRVSSPMSVDPYAQFLSSMAELRMSEETTGTSPPAHDKRNSPQVHHETLQRLCGEVLLVSLPSPSEGLSTASPKQRQIASEARPADGAVHDEEFTDISLDESPPKGEMEDSDEPNMVSHFSISDIDPDDAAELASLATISPISVDFRLGILSTVSQTTPGPYTTEETVSEGSKCVVIDSTPEILAPKPKRHHSPPRFVLEYRVSTAEQFGLDKHGGEVGT